MRMITFAAIHIGSYEVIMKIFEMSAERGMKELNFVRYRLKLGEDSYASRKISYEIMKELCQKLNEFKALMKEYQVKECKVCATSALRELKNSELALDQIRAKTGMKVELLSNSEQRFLEYMSVAAQEEEFNRIIQKKTAIADVGSGSLQISLFDQDSLVATQNIRLGTIWIAEKVNEMDYRSIKYSEVIEELIQNDLECFEQLYLKGQEIKNLIVVGEFVARIVNYIKDKHDSCITREQYLDFYEKNAQKNPESVVQMIGLSRNYGMMLKPTLILLKELAMRTKAESIWAAGTFLTDGIAYQFAVQKKYIKEQHCFENDIIASAQNISRRYHCNVPHTKAIMSYCQVLFSASKKLHGLGERERLLLRIAAMLHDCGKYISMFEGGKNAYHIIMSTEIIGLSHREREMIANIVYYNTMEINNQDKLLKQFGDQDYLTICKLTAILRVANVLDRSHKQKIKELKASLKNDKLILIADCALSEFSLENALFQNKIVLFEEVFGVEPVLKFHRMT